MTPTSKIIGNPLDNQQPATFSRDETGTKSDIPFEMTSRTQFYNLKTTANQNGVQFSAEEGYGKHKITFHYPYDFQTDPATEPPVELWEMVPNKVEKNIIDADNANTRALIQQDIATLNALVDDIQEYIFSVQNPPPGGSGLQYGDLDPTKIAFSTKPDSAAAALVLANLIVSGVKSQIIFAPTLRQTLTINDAYPIPATFLNVGSIISSATFPALFDIPNDLLFQFPFDSDPSLDASRPVLHYGWFMDAPEIRQIAWLKWQIVLNWSYGLWPEAQYGVPL
jgi:hypothetical protein